MGYVGSFEAIFEGMFGPQQHDAHVRRWRSEQFIAPRIGDFDVRMADMMAYAKEISHGR